MVSVATMVQVMMRLFGSPTSFLANDMEYNALTRAIVCKTILFLHILFGGQARQISSK